MCFFKSCWYLQKRFVVFKVNCCLNLPILCISESCIEIKNKLNFYFLSSLWCLTRFYEGLSPHKNEILWTHEMFHFPPLEDLLIKNVSLNKRISHFQKELCRQFLFMAANYNVKINFFKLSNVLNHKYVKALMCSDEKGQAYFKNLMLWIL